jgi:hypothetical protein
MDAGAIAERTGVRRIEYLSYFMHVPKQASINPGSSLFEISNGDRAEYNFHFLGGIIVFRPLKSALQRICPALHKR